MEATKRQTKTPSKPVKPYPDFPLSPHKRGWCKKINGKVRVICGHLPPAEAIKVYSRKYAELHAEPPKKAESKPQPAAPDPPPAPAPTQGPKPITVVELLAKYKASKDRDMESNRRSERSSMSSSEVLEQFAQAMPGPVAELRPDDFADYRHNLAVRFAPNTLDRHITQVRAMFNWGHRNLHITALPSWGDSFRKPNRTDKRRYAQEKQARDGKRLFEPDEIRRLLDAADPVMRAMIYLGINAALGNADVAKLPKSALDLEKGIVEFPRPKTAIERRAVLWPETVEALREAMKVRPAPADPQHDDLVFLTRSGRPWVRNDPHVVDGKVVRLKRIDTVAQRFSILIRKSGVTKRPNLNFYGLRHTWRTAADATGDMNAINRVMGHAFEGMASHYVQRIPDSRLRKLSDYVRNYVMRVQPADEESGITSLGEIPVVQI